MLLVTHKHVCMLSVPIIIGVNYLQYLSGLSNVDVGLLFCLTELPQMENRQLVLLLI